MRVTYFQETDTLYIALRDGTPAETKEINENVLLDLDANGKAVAVTIEHAKASTDNPSLLYEEVTAE
jgi:uncharacterized protein YuzE